MGQAGGRATEQQYPFVALCVHAELAHLSPLGARLRGQVHPVHSQLPIQAQSASRQCGVAGAGRAGCTGTMSGALRDRVPRNDPWQAPSVILERSLRACWPLVTLERFLAQAPRRAKLLALKNYMSQKILLKV